MAKKTNVIELPEAWKPIGLKMSLGRLIDEAYNARARRLELEKKVEEMKSEETRIKKAIIDNFTKSEVDGAKGHVATATLTSTVKPDVEDWKAFHTYILRTKDLSLLERRASQSACAEKWEAGEKIPGVSQFVHKNVSLTKIGAKK